ncbi:MAG: thioesterase family protein [Clostridia bacterium]|nr:thioesterase family protein [Clostridia bacterium]
MKNETVITARYAETDQMGIIHHSVYPVWFEVGRTNFIKMLGVTYSQLEKDGVMLPLCELGCKYINPVHYEDEVIIETSVKKVSFAKIEFSYRVIMKDSGKLMAEGFTVHGFVNSETFRPVNIKKLNPEMYQKLLNAQND